MLAPIPLSRPVRRVFGTSDDRIHGMSRRAADPRSRVADDLRRSIGGLSTAATSRMAEDLPWFRELSAEDRSWVGMILQAGIRGFVDWFEEGGDSRRPGGRHLGLRRRAPRAGRRHHPPADRRPGEALDRGRREQRRGHRRGRGRRGGAPRDLPLRPRGRLRHRRGLRPGRRGARRLGRPARGARRRRGAARRDRRGRALPGQRPGLEGARHGLRGARRIARPPDRDRPVRRRTPDRGRRRHGRVVRGPGRAAGGAARRRRPSRARPRR